MFHNMSIAKKLMLIIYSYLLVMFILLSAITFAVINAAVKSEMRESALNNVIHANLLIEKEQQYLYGIAKYYSISPEVQDLLVMSNAGPVSYTHLDVYKRQIVHKAMHSPD